ncbi:MAG: hypothetical protein NC192_06285, partial [Muribaculaceae bacterium]|nr:hypothetical protein [Muribaculaceae bacterium]
MKSIERKIVVTTILLVAISMYLLGSVAVTAIYLSATNIVTDDMEEVVQVASDRAAWELQAYSNISAGLGGINELSDPDVPDETKKEILSTWAARYDLERCNLIDEQGNGIDGNTYSD